MRKSPNPIPCIQKPSKSLKVAKFHCFASQHMTTYFAVRQNDYNTKLDSAPIDFPL